jgi:hypothetical protein
VTNAYASFFFMIVTRRRIARFANRRTISRFTNFCLIP